jgi:uncharacterized protein YjiS (DUF1127 family)
MQHTVLAISNWLDFKSFNFSNPFKGIMKSYTAYKKYNQTVNELSSLSDKELSDIGIHRGMIRSIANEIYLDDLRG